MMIKTPTKYFMVTGTAEGYMELNAFDSALLDAGIGNTNLVKMSSILPPECQEIDPVTIPLGSLLPVAYSGITCSVPGEVVSAGIAIALPEDPTLNGLIMEYSAYGRSDIVEEIVTRMAKEGMDARGYAIKEIKTCVVEHRVKNKGAAFAAVVLWD